MYMKKKTTHLILIGLMFGMALTSCTSQKSTLDVSSEEKALFDSNDEEPVEIANDETEYEIIIIEPGFNTCICKKSMP